MADPPRGPRSSRPASGEKRLRGTPRGRRSRGRAAASSRGLPPPRGRHLLRVPAAAMGNVTAKERGRSSPGAGSGRGRDGEGAAGRAGGVREAAPSRPGRGGDDPAL